MTMSSTFLQVFEPAEDVTACNHGSPFVKYEILPKEGGGRHMTVVLLKMITMPAAYIPIVHFLRTATSEDSVQFIINNPGGVLMSGLMIGDAMKSSKAAIETVAISIAASAAAEIFSCGHKLTVKPISHIMYHTASYLAMGKTTTHRKELEYTESLIESLMQHTISRNLLTEAEYRSIIAEGRDVFISGEELHRRLNESPANRLPKSPYFDGPSDVNPHVEGDDS